MTGLTLLGLMADNEAGIRAIDPLIEKYEQAKRNLVQSRPREEEKTNDPVAENPALRNIVPVKATLPSLVAALDKQAALTKKLADSLTQPRQKTEVAKVMNGMMDELIRW